MKLFAERIGPIFSVWMFMFAQNYEKLLSYKIHEIIKSANFFIVLYVQIKDAYSHH